MMCCSIRSRNILNIFEENIVCRVCFELDSFYIGREIHFIVHEESWENVLPILMLKDVILAENLEFEVLSYLSDLGSVIIVGNNYINCEGMFLIE